MQTKINVDGLLQLLKFLSGLTTSLIGSTGEVEQLMIQHKPDTTTAQLYISLVVLQEQSDNISLDQYKFINMCSD